jgi:tetratricopeptide (TPR) repeat protein
MMLPKKVFISHTTADDAFVAELRKALELQKVPTWVDSREMRGSDYMWPNVVEALQGCSATIVVLSGTAINSAWVMRELDEALNVQRANGRDNYRVIPLMLPGIGEVLVERLFGNDVMGIKIDTAQPGALQEALPAILAALGVEAPNDFEKSQIIDETPIAELILELSSPHEKTTNGTTRSAAKAKLVLEPSGDIREMVSPVFDFESPIGIIEAEDIRWYLEQYLIWPSELFQKRARAIEANLPQWGRAIYDALFTHIERQKILLQWQASSATKMELRFSIRLVDIFDPQTHAAEAHAAGQLLSIPWELLHDDKGYLFQSAKPVRVRRGLATNNYFAVRNPSSPLRILLVSPRPEGPNGEHWLDPRASALPLVEAIEGLGQLVSLTVLPNGNFPAFIEELNRASDANEHYDVVHFDGHGVYDPKMGLGALCFEAPTDSHKLQHRAMELKYASELGAEIQKHNIPLVFLEACETSKTEANPGASVAASLLQVGVASVVSMSHSVYVVTATKFVQAFYKALSDGCRIGAAMLAGQRALYQDRHRFVVSGIGKIDLQDWFVPILFQHSKDPILFKKIYSEKSKDNNQHTQQLQLGYLPVAPPHQFLGRDRELLFLERVLQQQQYAVVKGAGGMGKTTLANELARWLVRTKRFERAAFISLETHSYTHAILRQLGGQLTPGLSAVALISDAEALKEIAQAIKNFRTIIVFDNMESELPPLGELKNSEMRAVLQIFQNLLKVSRETRLIFTSREALPEPFEQHTLSLGALDKTQALALVSNVLRKQRIELPDSEKGNTHAAIQQLVETVGGHPRALVLLAPFLRDGIAKTEADITAIMQKIALVYPGKRDQSLLASVELSLQRLTEKEWSMLWPLSTFHGGFHYTVLAKVLEIEENAAFLLALTFMQTGLVENIDHGYFRIDPALKAYLDMDLDETERAAFQILWLDGIEFLVEYIYQQQFQDAQLSVQLFQYELPNLLAALKAMVNERGPEQIIKYTTKLEELLRSLGMRDLVQRVGQIREMAAHQIKEFNHAAFEAARVAIEQQLSEGKLQQAYQAAIALKVRISAAEENAYPENGYDRAMAYFLLGRILKNVGHYEMALAEIEMVRQAFEVLTEAGGKEADRVAAKCYTEAADCYLSLEKYEEAIQYYELSISYAEKSQDYRSVAVANGQLGSVYYEQRKYGAALEKYEAAKIIFAQLNEPKMVATALHQMGMVYGKNGNFEQADRHYREALKIMAPLGNPAAEASTLGELGKLYCVWKKYEDAMVFYQQAVDIFVLVGDLRFEGIVRNNFGDLFMKMGRLEEARANLLRAIECFQTFGLQARPWKTYNIINNLETTAGNPVAAAEARQIAIDLFREWRRGGAENHSRVAQLCAAVLDAIRAKNIVELQAYLEQEIAKDPEYMFDIHLLAILKGSRDTSILADEGLNYQQVVELEILFELIVDNG